ncbi:4146_t:CDS:2, partial [Cetraspora pellucida]
MALELRNTNIQNRALLYLQSILSKHEKHLKEEEQQYNIEELAEIIKKELLCLNVDQQAIFDKVIATVETETSVVFFIDGLSGTEKTFFY